MSALAAADAERALFIDFECLEQRPPKSPHPALLGVLVGSDGEELDQLITDERLAPARVASAVRPWLTHPGIAGHSTTNTPSRSDSLEQTMTFTITMLQDEDDGFGLDAHGASR